jgi:hypothetical protein
MMDKILNEINGFGKYQKVLLVLIGLMSSLDAMAIYATVFIAAKPKLMCKIKDSNSTEYLSNTCEVWSNLTKAKELNLTSSYECDWDTEYYGQTIINEWNLICDRVYLVSLTQVISFLLNLFAFE